MADADVDAIFARRVREFRQSRGMTQKQLADAMSAIGHRRHQTSIAKIEAGNRVVSVGEASKLASILCVPLPDLITDSPAAVPQWSPLHARRVAQDARDLHRHILSLCDQAARAASLAELVSALADQAITNATTDSGEDETQASANSLVGRLVEDAHDDSPYPTVGLVVGQVDDETVEVVWGEQRFDKTRRPGSREPIDALRPAREASRPFPMVPAGEIAAEAADFARHVAGKD